MQPGRPRSAPRQRATLVNARSRETRRALVRAAVQLWSEGDFDEAYAASSPADIARAAGVSKGTFYFHFAGKEEILLAMSGAVAESMLDQVTTAIERGVPLHTLIEQATASMARRVVRAPRAVALRAGSLGSRARAGEVTLAGPRISDAFAALVHYGKESGELDAEVDVEEGAAMLSAVTVDAIIRWGSGDRSDAWLRRTLPARVDIVLSGMSRMASSGSGTT